MTKQKLLLVDDDPDVLDAVSALLSDTYDVTVAEDGDEALDKLHADNYGCVILDLMMPRRSGAAVLAQLRAEAIHVPVILGSASVDVAERARELGAEDNIAKPYDFDALEAKIARLMGSGGGGRHEGEGDDTAENDSPRKGHARLSSFPTSRRMRRPEPASPRESDSRL